MKRLVHILAFNGQRPIQPARVMMSLIQHLDHTLKPYWDRTVTINHNGNYITQSGYLIVYGELYAIVPEDSLNIWIDHVEGTGGIGKHLQLLDTIRS